MILRKPYGILIKYFKFIHLILTGLFVYLTIVVNGMLSYYNDFIAGTVGKLGALKYLNNNYIIVSVLSIVICMIVYLLLRYKKKPRVLYLILIGFILLSAGMIYLVQGGIETIYFSILDTKSLRLYRDLLKILIVFQYLSIVIVLVRALGFDIKKFNFVADMHELNLDISDDEEVELTLGSTNNLKRKTNRKLREFKYYYLENKLFIHIILIILVVGFCSTLFVKNEVVDKVYKENEVVLTDNFSFQVVKSYITKKGYDDDVIATNDSSYVIVKMLLTSKEKREFNMANMILNINNNSYSGVSYKGDSFDDLGNVYRNQLLNGSAYYLFVYLVKDVDIDSKMELMYASDKTIKLKPVNLDELSNSVEVKLGEVADLAKTSLGKGKLIIKDFVVESSFSYPYKYEIDGNVFESSYKIVSNQGIIMKLDIESEYPYGLNDYMFLDRYAVLKYKIGDKEYVCNTFVDKTPSNEKNSLYLAVDKNISQAELIWMEIKIRNYKYNYQIKY